MVIFIDESGTHKQDGFASMAVVYIEVVEPEQFQEDLKKIIKKLNLEYFHWADAGWEVRSKFIREICSLDFKFKVAVFKNPAHPEKMIEAVFSQLITEKNISKILIDGKKPKWYEHRMKKVLRDRGVAVKKLKTVRSVSDFGIQVADALAGLVRYSYDNPKGIVATDLLNKLKKKDKVIGIYLLESGAIESFYKK